MPQPSPQSAETDALFKRVEVSRAQWRIMTLYERFEHIVALILTATISLIVVVALWRLLVMVYALLVLGALNPLDHEVFKTIFGMIMTLLIAMEFKHSILGVLARKEHIVQVKTVVLIALLALSRKFIILDVKSTSAETVAALALSVLSLGAVYWLLKERATTGEEAADR